MSRMRFAILLVFHTPVFVNRYSVEVCVDAFGPIGVEAGYGAHAWCITRDNLLSLTGTFRALSLD